MYHIINETKNVNNRKLKNFIIVVFSINIIYIMLQSVLLNPGLHKHSPSVHKPLSVQSFKQNIVLQLSPPLLIV